MDGDKNKLKALDSFVEKQDISKYKVLSDYYKMLRNELKELLVEESQTSALQSALRCLKLESKLQLFLFYLEQIEESCLDLTELEIVTLIEREYEMFSVEMINTELIGEYSLLF
ncbi:DUF7006 family protein [Enterococcus sp. BWR-S5]|uniref:DUF7006 family protein n=1 Tax=Enterococcus sp. BWR-S5 TaxID=2787714 RepID=UPI001921CB64|nr:hypothetical protein [Enterococcus sp. BWR-S5]MBL1225872.1 hypothetical protein [Enterococcus sp. BWR-S5]